MILQLPPDSARDDIDVIMLEDGEEQAKKEGRGQDDDGELDVDEMLEEGLTGRPISSVQLTPLHLPAAMKKKYTWLFKHLPRLAFFKELKGTVLTAVCKVR